MIALLTAIKTYWIAITLCSLTGITLLSIYPLPELPVLPVVSGGDKIQHLLAYAVLVFPVALRKPNSWLLIALFFIVWSGGIELLQPYVNRHAKWLDMAANTAGIVCGLLAAQVINNMASVGHSRQ